MSVDQAGGLVLVDNGIRLELIPGTGTRGDLLELAVAEELQGQVLIGLEPADVQAVRDYCTAWLAARS